MARYNSTEVTNKRIKTVREIVAEMRREQGLPEELTPEEESEIRRRLAKVFEAK